MMFVTCGTEGVAGRVREEKTRIAFTSGIGCCLAHLEKGNMIFSQKVSVGRPGIP
jgi:hypothetical protein